jgi:hypothetical protein
VKRDMKSQYGGDRFVYEKTRKSVSVATARVQAAAHACSPLPKGEDSLFGRFSVWLGRTWVGKLWRSIVSPSRRAAIRLDSSTVPIGFEHAYSCCGQKLRPVWKRKRRGGRYYIHHFKCLVCKSTTVYRWDTSYRRIFQADL